MRASKIEDLFELASSMNDVINLSIGEPDADVPDVLKDAAARHIKNGKNKYGPLRGIPQLREKIAAKYAERGLDVKVENVSITMGAQNAIFAGFASVLRSGDEVIVFSPAFPTYAAVATLIGARVRFVNTTLNNGYVPDPDRLRSVINSSTRAIVINSPSNPTGAVYDRRLMRELIDVASEAGAYVLSDEVYEEFVYEGSFVSAAEFADSYDRVLVVNSFSKTLCITGWRLGYLLAPQELSERIGKVLLYGHTCPPTFAQYAILDVIDSDEIKEFVKRSREEYLRRRDVAVLALNYHGIEVCPPKGALYVFPRLPAGLDDDEFCLSLLNRERVVAVPGNTFGPGGEGHFRISITSPAQIIEEGVRRIGRFVREYVSSRGV
ncbi:MAG: pyridoxal phosphate-dependent aminotransferase [Thaumarchaeota archaeon]|nr:pyridoxal phosphate-dependent aminotransferase [Candidatus Calditenuaceae archaeon]MDW8187053.1 pyridoxal phosphate-dependent aminotransferase [Nitrososphaerota archaeon]